MKDIRERIVDYRSSSPKRDLKSVGIVLCGTVVGFLLVFAMFAVSGRRVLPGWTGLPMMIALLVPVGVAMQVMRRLRQRALQKHGLCCALCGKPWEQTDDIKLVGSTGKCPYCFAEQDEGEPQQPPEESLHKRNEKVKDI